MFIIVMTMVNLFCFLVSQWGEENAYACYPLLEEERFWDDFFVPYLGFFESLSQVC